MSTQAVWQVLRRGPDGRISPVVLSACAHASVSLALLAGILLGNQGGVIQVPIDVLDQPVLAPENVRPVVPFARPKPRVVIKAKEVFGIAKASITSEAGIEVKAGNTVAKAPDQETLEGDESALPIPEEEFLVSQMPVLVADVRVPYPPEARKAGLQGAVVFELLIDADGKVRQAKLIEGPGGGLNEAAAGAVMRLKFRPALVEAKPVAVRIRYAYRFVLEK